MKVAWDQSINAETQQAQWSILRSAAVVSIFAAIVYSVIAVAMYRARVFDQFDIMFDTDAMIKLDSLAHGWGMFTVIHPLLPNLFSVPIRVAGMLLSPLSGHSPEVVRTVLGIFIAPVCVAISGTVLGSVLALLRLRYDIAMLVVVLFALSWSSIVFGAVPESYGPTLLVINASLYLFTRITFTRDLSVRASIICFSVAIFFAGGLTISNFALVGMIGLAAEFYRDRRIGQALSRMILAGLIGLTAVVAVAVTSAVLRNDKLGNDLPTFVVNNMAEDHLLKFLVRMPSGFANSISPLDVREKPAVIKDQAMDFQFTLEAPSTPNFVGIAALVLLGLFCLRVARTTPEFRPILTVAGLIIVFNWLLHTAWGVEIFLYSTHWITALCVLFGVVAQQYLRSGRAVWIAGGVVAIVGINNLMTISRLIDVVSSAGRA